MIKLRTKPKIFNLEAKFPNVLLLGNGILKSLAELNNLKSIEWIDYIISLSEKVINEEKSKLDGCPYPLLTSILAPYSDTDRQNKYLEKYKTMEFKDNSILRDLVSLNFDSILTTNYTYEIENCFKSNYSNLQSKNNYYKIISNDNKQLLHTYNQFKDSPPIWHIHGELRNKSSIIGTHDEYARLINKIVQENKANENKYYFDNNSLKYSSWIDYFLMSNLYIVGFDFNFSELDLWWLLNRRMREKADIGKIYFYEPLFSGEDDNSKKLFALEKMNVECMTFDFELKEDKSNFGVFYKKAIDDIKKKLKGV